MEMLLLVARIALSLVFAVAGFTKLVDRPGFEKTLVDFGVPLWFARRAAMALPFAEFTAALLLIFRITAWWGSLATFVLLLTFTIAIAYNLWKGQRPDCNCFGQLQSAPISGWTLARNGILLLIAGFIAWRGTDQPGLNSINLLENFSIWSVIAVLFGVCMIMAIVLQSWFILNILRQNGRLLQRIEVIETRSGTSNAQVVASSSSVQPLGLPVGALAPTFSLPHLNNGSLSLETLRSEGKPVLLLFSDPECGPCTALMPTVALWQRQHASLLRVIMISVGSPETNRIKQQEYGLEGILLQSNREVAELYQAHGTPSAVLVRPDGTIGSELAPGADAISALVSSVVAAEIEPSSDLPSADEVGTPVNEPESGEYDLITWLNWVEFWSGPLSYEDQQSDIRFAIRDNCGTIVGQMYSVDPLNGQFIEMGQITGTRTDNRLDLVTHTGLQITADLTANTLNGQVVFPEWYGEASITSQFTLAPIFSAHLPRPLKVQG